MKKILYRKFLADCFVFFIISLVSTSVIIWIIQAVNYLDIVIYEGRDYSVYLNYALLSFPKIVSKILPFAFPPAFLNASTTSKFISFLSAI